MGIFNKRQQRGMALVINGEKYEDLCISGYAPISKNPEVLTAANYIADMVSSMTIYLMRNSKAGDVRQNTALARKIDIDPYSLGTRKTWMFNIVRNLIIHGNQIVLPTTKDGLIDDLIPLPPTTPILQNGNSYIVQYNGRRYAPDEVLHFVLNPDPEQPWRGRGYATALRDVVTNLAQAANTKRGFMSSKWKPSVIVKVDALIDEFASPEGRQKLLNEYIDTSTAGEPWMIPAENFSVEQIKPLTLNDLAINETVTLDKKTVAGVMGVPAYVLGAGTFNQAEHRNFVSTKILPIAQIISQELTKKLLISPDLYFYMNARSLYDYDIKELADVGKGMYQMGLMEGNEVRGWLNLSPKDGLDQLVMLENYIPADAIGQQKKLYQDGE